MPKGASETVAMEAGVMDDACEKEAPLWCQVRAGCGLGVPTSRQVSACPAAPNPDGLRFITGDESRFGVASGAWELPVR